MDAGRTRDHAVQVEEESLKFAEVDVLRLASSRLHAENDHRTACFAYHSPYRLCTFGFETAAPSKGDQVARVASGELEDGGTGLPMHEHKADIRDARRIGQRPRTRSRNSLDHVGHSCCGWSR